MPYCKSSLQTEPENAEAIIIKFAVDKFRAENAYPLTGGMWNIDAGENDVRAIYRDNNGIIKFFCRSKQDLPRIEKKIAEFASEKDGAYIV